MIVNNKCFELLKKLYMHSLVIIIHNNASECIPRSKRGWLGGGSGQFTVCIVEHIVEVISQVWAGK